MTIRKATLSDALSIAKVHVQSWHETYESIVNTEILNELSVENKTLLWHKVIQDLNQEVLVFEENDKVLGFADFYFHPQESFGEIRAIYLLKSIQGKGIGSDLIKRGLALFQKNGYREVHIEVFDQNPSRYFYERLGAKCIDMEDASDYGKDLKILHYWIKI